eukprot:COSAG03_NODE_1840_length_3451_cov_6.463305_3_plen_108_part_00
MPAAAEKTQSGPARFWGIGTALADRAATATRLAIAPPGAISAGDEDGEPQPSLQGLECHQPATLAPVERDTAAASRVEWYCLRPHGSPDKRSRITIERHSVRSARTR